MDSGFGPGDLDLLRAYVTAKDGHEYDNLDKGIVSLDITHNYLKVYIHDVRLPLTSTVFDLKRKIVQHTGTPVEFQTLLLQNRSGQTITELSNDNATLQFYGIQSGMIIHCIDSNPNSLAKDGGLDDVSKVKKYVMSDEEYQKRPNTVRAFKQQNEPHRIYEGHDACSEYGEETVHNIHVNDRCEVQPGSRRGTVKWIGQLDEKDKVKGGYWVGIALDEPLGRNDGSYQGKRLFECLPKYGIFSRGENVKVGDYPEEDLDLDEEF